MKKVIKQTLLILAVLIGLSVLPLCTNHIHALESNVHIGSQSTKGAAHGGPCKERTGFFMTVTYAPDLNATPTLMGTGAILPCKAVIQTMDERYKNDYNGTDTKLIPRRTDMLKVAPFLGLWVGVSIRILLPRRKLDPGSWLAERLSGFCCLKNHPKSWLPYGYLFVYPQAKLLLRTGLCRCNNALMHSGVSCHTERMQGGWRIKSI